MIFGGLCWLVALVKPCPVTKIYDANVVAAISFRVITLHLLPLSGKTSIGKCCKGLGALTWIVAEVFHNPTSKKHLSPEPYT